MSDPVPSSGAWSDGAHRLAVRVYYEDTDFTGVVYYANYLKFFERGRTDALRSAGVSHAELLDDADQTGFAVREVWVKYHRPARIDDALVVQTRVTAAKGARITFAQTITCDGALVAEAWVEAACITLDGRPKRLPQAVKDALEDGPDG